VLDCIAVQRGLADQVVQYDAGPDVIDPVHKNYGQHTVPRAIEGQRKEDRSCHCQHRELPPIYVINVSQNQRNVPVRPKKAKHQSGTHGTKKLLQSG